MPVARIGESVSYSDKLKEQAQLINKRRQQNLNVEIAQEEKNRQFRDQQLQTFYDFDVSGMSAEHIKAIGKLQANMANSLDPNSEDHYQNTQQLIADISFLNNVYNVASRHRDQRQSGAQQMVGLMTGEVEANPGEEFVNEGIDGLNNANALWDQGGFSGEINVGGSAGNRSMSGVPLVPNPDGGWMSGEGEVSFFENSLTNDSSPLYRPTIIASAPTLNKMAEEAMSDEALNGTNTEEVADLRWSTMNDSKKERIRKEEYDKVAKEGETTAFEDLTDEQKKALGIDDESLRDKYRDKLQEGIDARGKERIDTLFDVQKTTEGLTNLKEKININVSDENFAGTVVAADYAKGLNIEDLKDADGNVVIPIEVTYLKGNVTRKETIEPSNPAYQQLIQAMGEGGINEMFDRSGYGTASEGSANTANDAKVKNPEDAASPSPQQIEVANLDQQRLDILEGTEGKEGVKAIEERAEALRQESLDSAPDEVGFFGRFSGTESKSDVEARPLTDFMSPSEKIAYNQGQRDLADIDSQLGVSSGPPEENLAEVSSIDAKPTETPQNPAAQPVQAKAPETAAAIENSNVEALNPNTGEPVTVEASAPEKQQAAMAAFGGIVPLETQESEIQEVIQELFTNVVPDSTWIWTNAQEKFKSGEDPDPVPAWCAAWVADMILRADPNFDFSAVESEKYGQKGSVNRTRARQYETIGELVSKTGGRYDAQVGDIVIKKSGKTGHHIGFFAGYAENGDVLILGGNQGDSLNVTPYPSSSIETVRRIDVAAIKKEDVEKISATINSSGKTS
jgi:hypothetical protein